jgi:septum site-determining protein MinC
MAQKTRPGVGDNVRIKGTRAGLVVRLGEGSWSKAVAGLATYLEQNAAFFDGARAILNTGPRELGPEQLRELQDLLRSNGIEICAVETQTEKTAAAAAKLGIPTAEQTEDDGSQEADAHCSPELEEGLFLKRTIRSGQTVHYAGHVTVLGDVNPGGHVVAGGDVVIWGKLRGTVHAGASGDHSAVVCALVLSPTQLRIGSRIARSPEGEPRGQGIPEMARVQDDAILVEPWNNTKS